MRFRRRKDGAAEERARAIEEERQRDERERRELDQRMRYARARLAAVEMQVAVEGRGRT